ncbi:MAG: hypothetical protein R2883_00590 [Caldisericia bacterium]
MDDSCLNFLKWNGENWVTIDGEIYDPVSMNSYVIGYDKPRNDIPKGVVRTSTHIHSFEFDLDKNDFPHVGFIMTRFPQMDANSPITSDGIAKNG